MQAINSINMTPKCSVAMKSQAAYTNPMAPDMGYIPQEEPKKKGVFMTALLGIAAAVGIGLAIYKGKQVGKVQAEFDSFKKATETTMKEATDSIAAKDALIQAKDKALTEANKTIEELKNPPKFFKKIGNWFKKTFSKKDKAPKS